MPFSKKCNTFESIMAMHSIDENGCWIFDGSIRKDGYGHVRFTGKRYLAHRLYWIIFRGYIFDKNLHVLHKCDVRSCVNPDHLFLGTHTENMQDMMRKGRGNKKGPGKWRYESSDC